MAKNQKRKLGKINYISQFFFKKGFFLRKGSPSSSINRNAVKKLIRSLIYIFPLAFIVIVTINAIAYSNFLHQDNDLLFDKSSTVKSFDNNSRRVNTLFVLAEQSSGVNMLINSAFLLVATNDPVEDKIFFIDPRIELISNREITLESYFQAYATFNSGNGEESAYKSVLREVSNLLGVTLSDIVIIKDSLFEQGCSKYDNGCFLNIISNLDSNLNSPRYYYDTFILGTTPSVFDLIQSSLNKADVIKYTHLSSTVSSRSIYSIDEKMGALTQNGSIRLNAPELRKQIRSWYAIREILTEQALVEIYNGSNRLGFGSLTSLFLSNYGVSVVRVGNFEPVNQNILYIIDQSSINRLSNTIELIQEFFGGELEMKVGSYKYNSIGDLVLVLGSNE